MVYCAIRQLSIYTKISDFKAGRIIKIIKALIKEKKQTRSAVNVIIHPLYLPSPRAKPKQTESLLDRFWVFEWFVCVCVRLRRINWKQILRRRWSCCCCRFVVVVLRAKDVTRTPLIVFFGEQLFLVISHVTIFLFAIKRMILQKQSVLLQLYLV